MSDPADLSRLADIVAPPPVPWWPPAPGWWILLAALLAGALILLAAGLQRWRRSAYRRAALIELDRLGAPEHPSHAAAVSAILKRTALAAYPRERVAPLSGRDWLTFLDHSAGGDVFTKGAGAGLVQAALGVALGNGPAIFAAARGWVKRHRVEG